MNNRTKNIQLQELMNTFYRRSTILVAKRVLDDLHTSHISSRNSGIEMSTFVIGNETFDLIGIMNLLLDFYGILELGIITQSLPGKLNLFLQKEIKAHLQIDKVKTHSLTQYISLLPTKLVNRFSEEEESNYSQDDPTQLNSIFSHFLSIENYLEHHSSVRYFVKNYSVKRILDTYKNMFDQSFLMEYHHELPYTVESHADGYDFDKFRFFQSYMDFIDAIEMIYGLFLSCKGLAEVETAMANFFARFFNGGYMTDLVEFMKVLEKDENVVDSYDLPWHERERYVPAIQAFLEKITYIHDIISISTGELVYA